MFGTFLEKTQAILSRSFLFGSFFPTLAFVVVNLTLSAVTFPSSAAAIGAALPADATKFTMSVVAGLTAVAILGFMLGPMVPVFRRIMEGEYLPPSIKKRMVLAERRRFLTLYSSYTESGAWWKELQHIEKNSQDILGAARNDVGPRVANTSDALAHARSTKQALDNRLGVRGSGPADKDVILAAVQTLEAAFRSRRDDAGQTDVTVLAELDQMQTELLRLLQERVSHASLDFQLNAAAVRSDFADPDFRPTLLANRRAASERYPLDAYGVDFDFIWPRLRLALIKNKELNDIVDTAQGQLDFALLSAALSTITTIVWVPLTAIWGDSFPAYLSVIGLGPVAIWFFFQLTIAAQDAFGAVLSTAIDAMRFDLLTVLHRPLPVSLDQERKDWKELQLALYSGGTDLIRYKHSKP